MSVVTDAARRLPPGPAQILDVGTASTLEVGLVLCKNEYVLFQAKGDTVYLAFGVAGLGAATANDLFLADGQREEYYIDEYTTHFRAISDSAGNLLLYSCSAGEGSGFTDGFTDGFG